MAEQRACPEGAVLMIKGEAYRCDWMDRMTPESENHEGWAHSNKDAEAIWNG